MMKRLKLPAKLAVIIILTLFTMCLIIYVVGDVMRGVDV